VDDSPHLYRILLAPRDFLRAAQDDDEISRAGLGIL